MPALDPGTRVATPATATGLTTLDLSSQAVSLAFWHKRVLGTGANYGCVFAQQSTSYREGYWVQFNADRTMQFNVGHVTVGQAAISGPMVLYDRWAHYAVTWDGARALFYRNGACLSSVAQVFTPTFGGTRNTKLGNGGDGIVRGSLFDLQVYPNITLPPGQIRATMDPRTTVGGMKGRWARWEWRDVPGGTMRDESGNGNTLTQANIAGRCLTVPEPNWQRAAGALGARRRPVYRTVAAGVEKIGARTLFLGGLTMTGAT